MYTTRDGLPDNNINRIYEDSHGNVWLSSYNPTGLLTRWERATGTFHLYAKAQGIPPLNWTNVFAEEQAVTYGSVFTTVVSHAIVKASSKFSTSPMVSPAESSKVFTGTEAAAFWIATSGGGAARVDDPAAARPLFRSYTLEYGLSSNSLRCFVEDRWKRIYFGTAKGIDRLDPAAGRIKHYTRGDGLISNEVTAAFADRHGRLWFGTRNGLSALVPKPDRSESPP